MKLNFVKYFVSDYYFVGRDEMLKSIGNGEFLEHTEFSGNIYGTRYVINPFVNVKVHIS